MSLGETIIYVVLEGCFYVGRGYPCIASVGLIFFGVRAVFSVDACCLFPQCILAIIPLIGGVTGVVVTRACTGYWLGPPLLLCGCYCPVRGWVCSLAVGVEAPRSVSELQSEVGGIGAFLQGEEPLSIPLPELFTSECALLCHLSPIVWAHKVYCPEPRLNLGNAGNQPWCPSGVVFTRPPAQIR